MKKNPRNPIESPPIANLNIFFIDLAILRLASVRPVFFVEAIDLRGSRIINSKYCATAASTGTSAAAIKELS